jgi:hypothetical protein
MNELFGKTERGEMIVKCEVVLVPILPRLFVFESHRAFERDFMTPAHELSLLALDALLAVGLTQG